MLVDVQQSEELYHYGVKGMKWGVRRYQNKDGSLTPRGKKKISKEYERTAKKVSKALNKSATRRYVDSYNKAADEMNNGGIDRFNSQQRKKYGDDFAKRDGYASDYEKLFRETFAKHYDQILNDFYKNNKNYQKSKVLVDKYNMTSWNDLARRNEEKVEEVRRAVRNYS